MINSLPVSGTSPPSSDSKYLATESNGKTLSPTATANGGVHHSPDSSVKERQTPLKPVVNIGVASVDTVLIAKHNEAASTNSVSEHSKKGVADSSSKMPKSKGPTVYDKWGSVEIEPGVKCNAACTENHLVSTPVGEPNVKTAWDVFQHGLALSPKGNCLGWRSGDAYSWWTYTEVAERVRRLGAAFSKKTSLQRQGFVGIYAACIPQWVVCALACNSRSYVIVPLYDTLGPESCSYIINQVDMSVLFVDSPAAVGRVLDSAKDTPTLKTIISFQELSADLLEKAKANDISLITLSNFTSGTEDAKETNTYDLPTAEDIAMVQFTSGTTGFPKGVIQTHRAYVANFTGIDFPFSTKLDSSFVITPNDICLQFLPMAHAYAQIACTWLLFHGAAIGFFGGNVLKLFEDATVLRPTIMPLVPRLMNRFYSKVIGEIGHSGLKARLFWYCYERKKDLMLRGTITRDSVWDMIAFRKIQRLLGGQVRIMSVGSAPVSAEVLEFWRVCFGALVVEGYGQTECTAVASIAIGPKGGNVGHPLVCNMIKLADAEECGYFVKNGRGEVCIKGPNVMNGYYKQPDKTAEAIDADGWLHTGDIGEFLPDGSLRIFDRKKHIFKLAQGEYIAPEKIENTYAMCPVVAQLFVDGSSLESFTVAVVVPDQTVATTWAKEHGVDSESVMTNVDFRKFILTKMTDVGKENKLNSLEQIKNLYLTADGFTPTNGLLTPSLKNKRPELRRYFKDQIDAMYRTGPLINSGMANGKAVNGK